MDCKCTKICTHFAPILHQFAPILHRCKKIRCNSETIGSNNKLSSSDKMSLQEVTKCHYWTKYA